MKVKGMMLLAGAMMMTTSILAQKVGPWDLGVLKKAPKFRETDTAKKSGVKGILYKALDYKGKPVEVFAYYSLPKGKAPKGGWPGVVCAHGGGGTAFDAWVKLWNSHGYAAISMDLEGHYPIKKKGQKHRVSTENPGPKRQGRFAKTQRPIEEQWYYNAIAQVVLANSFLRSRPEVNPNKIGLTGISWGGTITSTVMGVDDRFVFAIPVYGCGFLQQSTGHQSKINLKDKAFQKKNYDGSAYFKNVKIPTFWVNGANDPHFTPNITQASMNAVKGPTFSQLDPKMKHGHMVGWRPKEIYAFADSVVKNSHPLVSFEKPSISGNTAKIKCSADAKDIAKAVLFYTKDSGNWVKRKWENTPAKVNGSNLSASIPAGSTAVYFGVTDKRKLMTTSQYIETK